MRCVLARVCLAVYYVVGGAGGCLRGRSVLGVQQACPLCAVAGVTMSASF